MTLRTALAIAGGLSVFLVVSFLLARFLTAENRERDAIVDVLRAQAAGDAPAVVAAIDGCAGDAACVAAARERARALERPGSVKVLSYQSGTSYALGSADGTTRVAWNTSRDDRPVVQCVEVRRRGLTFLSGTITVAAVGAPIPGEASCPA